MSIDDPTVAEAERPDLAAAVADTINRAHGQQDEDALATVEAEQ